MTEMKFVWDNQAVALLKQLWSENLSAAEIVAQLSVGLQPGRLTRNSILGKVHRLGLSCRDRPVRKPRQTKRRRGGDVMVAVSSLFKKSAPLPIRLVDTSEPVPSVMFCDLVGGQCKFIPGDDITYDVMCCGAPTGDILMPWCSFHTRSVFQPMRSMAKRQADAERAAIARAGKKKVAA